MSSEKEYIKKSEGLNVKRVFSLRLTPHRFSFPLKGNTDGGLQQIAFALKLSLSLWIAELKIDHVGQIAFVTYIKI